MDIVRLALRDDEGDPQPGQCAGGNDYDGRMGVRISAVFVVLVTSLFGTIFPIVAKRHKGLRIPEWTFFVAKYFGSGVIIATAFIHLLAPANDALTDSCLTGPITEYDWVEGIALMTIMVMFILELLTMRYANFGEHEHDITNPHASDDISLENRKPDTIGQAPTHMPGEDHLGHRRDHTDNEAVSPNWAEQGKNIVPEAYSAQLTAVFILEFGVVFHSIFVGLTLAVSGPEFPTLYVVIVFHQMFEGLGLGSRLATVPWPRSKRWTPYLLALGYGITTPIAIAIGLGVRSSYPPNSATTLIVNGVFDSISAGILIYTGLVELMAHEFMFSPYMSRAPIKVVLSAFGMMCLGAGLMALLGKWA